MTIQPPVSRERHSTVLGAESRAIPAFAAILLGMVLLYGVGFAPIAVLHNAAHDTRHSIAFPCH